VKIDIDDALLARHQELLKKIIWVGNSEHPDRPSQEQRARRFELEGVARQIIDITTIAYFKRGDNENLSN